MYKILEVEDKVRVPPTKFDLELKDAIQASLQEKLEGIVNKKLGIVLSIIEVDNVGEGRIFPEDGAIHYPAKFKLAVFQPEMHEVVEGEVIEVTEFGAFLRFGPVDGMIHVSQLMNDFVSFDNKSNVFLGRDSKRKVKEGDRMKARVISVSMEGDQYKIGLTARQPGLGNPEWPKEKAKTEKDVIEEKQKAEKKEGKKEPKGKK